MIWPDFQSPRRIGRNVLHIVEFLKIHMYFVFTLCMFIFSFFLSFIEYSLSTSHVYVQQTVQPPPPPHPTPPHPAQSVICLGFGSFVGIVSWIRLLLLLKGGGGEGGGAESMGCFYKPINTSFIRLSPMLSFLFISLDIHIQIMEQSSLKCNYAGRNRNSSWIHSYRRIKASFKSVLKWD